MSALPYLHISSSMHALLYPKNDSGGFLTIFESQKEISYVWIAVSIILKNV